MYRAPSGPWAAQVGVESRTGSFGMNAITPDRPVAHHLAQGVGAGVDHKGPGPALVTRDEAGQFFPIPASPPQFGVSQTGKVDKFSLEKGFATMKWSTSFNSLYDTFIAGPTGEVLQLADHGSRRRRGGEGQFYPLTRILVRRLRQHMARSVALT
jgi:hypothetical protein